MTPAPQPDQRTKIFVLDDSQTFLAYARVLLESQGYQVFTFDSPLGITREVIRQQPDLVIVDVNMRMASFRSPRTHKFSLTPFPSIWPDETDFVPTRSGRAS